MGNELQNQDTFFRMLMQNRRKQDLSDIFSCNEKTQTFGLVLTEKEATELLDSRDNSLKKYQRVEFSTTILPQLIEVFCDSSYIQQEEYKDILEELLEIFYEFKQESMDLLTDDELLTFMREQYETVCFGDLDYLEGTCLARFAEAIKSGYQGYQSTGGSGEYEQFSTEMRWDKELYMEALRELCWR